MENADVTECILRYQDDEIMGLVVGRHKGRYSCKAVDPLASHVMVDELVVVKNCVDVSRMSHVNQETVYAELGGKTMGFESVGESVLAGDLPFIRERNKGVVRLSCNCTVHRTSNED